MTNTLSMEASIGLLKLVPGGHVRLGSRFDPREAPPRSVYVPEFEMAHAPVTVRQYEVFLKGGGVRQREWWRPEGWAWVNGESDGWGREDRWAPDAWDIQSKRPYHPIVGITAHEAEAYCAWLSRQKAKVVRLPTEDEWERAARGDDGRPFPWGEEFDPALTNTFESERRDTAPVATFERDVSPFGVLEMGGNVQDWTSTAYTPRPGESHPEGPLRVARGGSFNDNAYGARTSYRRAYPPGYFFPFLGFRLVVEHR